MAMLAGLREEVLPVDRAVIVCQRYMTPKECRTLVTALLTYYRQRKRLGRQTPQSEMRAQMVRHYQAMLRTDGMLGPGPCWALCLFAQTAWKNLL
jgi:hypothetical protein